MMQQLQNSGSNGVSLGETFPRSRIFGAGEDVRFTSCCADSRKCQPGDLFVALLGKAQDGHDFAQEALARGATAVLAERLLPVPAPICVVQDTRDAFGQVCHALAGQPTSQMQVIGVSGTHGKTSTSVLLSAILQAAQKPCGLLTSLGRFDGCQQLTASQTTPPQAELAHQFSQMLANGCSHAVVELSSRGLAEHRLAGTSLSGAILTNLRRDHLDIHGSLENYRRAKFRMFDFLHKTGFVVTNADDPASQRQLPKIDQPVITVGIHNEAEIKATVIERFPSEQTVMLSAGNDSIPLRTHIIGDQHIYNCLSAAAAGLIMGIDLPTIVRGLESIEEIPGRMQRIECGQDFRVFVDTADTSERLGNALRSLRRVTDGRLICVYGPDGRKPSEDRPLLGRAAERVADLTIITNNNPQHEPALRVAHDVLDGYQNPSTAHLCPDRQKAIQYALEEAQEGDTVLVAGKGNDTFQLIGGAVLPFDDPEVIRSWFKHSSSSPLLHKFAHRTIPIIDHLN